MQLFEKNTDKIQVDLKKNIVIFENGSIAKISGMEKNIPTMEKLDYMESMGFTILHFDFM